MSMISMLCLAILFPPQPVHAEDAGSVSLSYEVVDNGPHYQKKVQRIPLIGKRANPKTGYYTSMMKYIVVLTAISGACLLVVSAKKAEDECYTA